MVKEVALAFTFPHDYILNPHFLRLRRSPPSFIIPRVNPAEVRTPLLLLGVLWLAFEMVVERASSSFLPPKDLHRIAKERERRLSR